MRLLALAMLLITGCREAGAPPPTPTTPRIVSLSPALTRTAVDLGLGPTIIGRSPFCDAVDAQVPVVGDLQNIDYERLVDLAPTHILVQPSALGIDGGLARLCTEHGWQLGAFGHINTLDDVEDVVRAMPRLFDNEAELAPRAAALLNEFALALSPLPDPAWRGPTLLVYHDDPVGIFGRATYLDEMLRRLGATNASTAEGWAQITLEDVTWLNPGAIIVVGPRATIGRLGSLEIDAIRDGRVATLTDPETLRPSTGLIGVARALRGILQELGEESTQ